MQRPYGRLPRQMVRKPPETAVFFITLPHESFVSIHRPGFHGGTARRSIRRPLPRRRTGGRLLPGVRQLRPQLGMPAVRVRYGGVRHALRHGAARRDQNHARGAGTPGLRSGTPDPARTAAARTSAAGDGTAIRRTLVRLRRNVHSLSRGELHAPRRQALPPSGTGAAVARSLRIRRGTHGLRTVRNRDEVGQRRPHARVPDARMRIFPRRGIGRMERRRAVFNRNAAASIRRTRRCGPSGRAHTK